MIDTESVDRILDAVLSLDKKVYYGRDFDHVPEREVEIVYVPVPYPNMVNAPTMDYYNPATQISSVNNEKDIVLTIIRQGQDIAEIQQHLKTLDNININVKYLKNLWNERYFEREVLPPKNTKKVKPKTERVQNLVDFLMEPKTRKA